MCTHPLGFNFILLFYFSLFPIYLFIFIYLFIYLFFHIFGLGFDPFNNGFYCTKFVFPFNSSSEYLDFIFVSEEKQRINKNYHLATQNKNFDSRARRCKKSTSKLFTAKSFSCKFKNLSRIFYPEFSED